MYVCVNICTHVCYMLERDHDACYGYLKVDYCYYLGNPVALYSLSSPLWMPLLAEFEPRLSRSLWITQSGPSTGHYPSSNLELVWCPSLVSSYLCFFYWKPVLQRSLRTHSWGQNQPGHPLASRNTHNPQDFLPFDCLLWHFWDYC